MRTYVITGGTTGIGACVKQQLEQQGHRVYNVDYKGGDFCAGGLPTRRKAARLHWRPFTRNFPRDSTASSATPALARSARRR